MARLFVAVPLPEGVLDLLESLPRPERSGLRWTRREQWHVTLRFLGEVDPVGPVVEALSAVPAPVAEAAIGPAVERFGQRVLHVPVEGLGDLAAAVVAVTADMGEPPEDRAFAGHVTLARAGGRGRPRPDLRPLAGTAVTGAWEVNRFDLMASRLRRDGVAYQLLERFPLG